MEPTDSGDSDQSACEDAATKETIATKSMPRKSIYHSAVDWWIAAMLIAGPAVCAVLAASLLRQGRQGDAVTCLIAGAITLLVTAVFTVPCRYTILPDSLTIRCGILFYRVSYDHIKSAELSGSWLSGPALSTKRVKVSTASQFHLISPIDRERFIAELTDAMKD